MKRALILFSLIIVGCGPRVEVEIKTDPLTNQVLEEYEYYRNEENDQIVKHGYYRSFWEDGPLKEEGRYKHGIKEGKWAYYLEGIKREGTYRDGKLVGVYSYYDCFVNRFLII